MAAGFYCYNTHMTEFSRTNLPGRFASCAFSFGIALVLLSLLGGGLNWWSTQGVPVFASGKWGALLGGVLIVISAFSTPRLEPSGFAAGLLVIFFSDWLCRGYNLIQGPSIRGEIILFSIITGVLLAKRSGRLIAALAPFSAIMLSWIFLDSASGRALFSDDNATFIYRLTLLKENFPFIPFYYPLWNAGLDARDFFATGALNVFLIFSPLLYSFPVDKVYNLVVAGVLFVLAPLCTMAAARLARFPWRTAAIAASISLAPSLLWFRWGLKYGTLGFVTSAALFPLVYSLGCLIVDRFETLSWSKSLLFLVTFSLMLLWTPTGLATLPLIGLAFFRLPSLLKKPGILKLTAAIVALNLPWVVLFWAVSDVSKFIQSEQQAMHAEDSPAVQVEASGEMKQFKHRVEGFNLQRSLKRLREAAVSTHPLILLFLVPGLLLLPVSHRLGYTLGVGWLIFLGTVVAAMKPQLEFDRMLLMLALLGCTPAAAALNQLFEQSRKGLSCFLGAALAGGFLLTTPFSAASVVSNRSLEHFVYASDIVRNLAAAIREHGGNGRTIFSGFVLHDLSGGHVAPLSFMTERPLIASSPFHNLWRYKEAFSQEALANGAEGIRRYLDLFNVSSVITHTQKWREFFKSRPDEYEQVWQEDRFRIFKRTNHNGSYFLEGAGEVLEQGPSFIRIRADSPQAVIKFRWYPFLKSSSCILSERVVADDIRFIELSGCQPGQEVRIESGSPFERIKRAAP